MSETGIQIGMVDGLDVGVEVALEWVNGARTKAKVVRVGDGFAGLKFDAPVMNAP